MEATFNMSKLVFKGEMLSLWDKESVLYSIYKVKYTVFMYFWGIFVSVSWGGGIVIIRQISVISVVQFTLKK